MIPLVNRLGDLIAEHIKECSSDHCAACMCGWDVERLADPEVGALAHAQHLAEVIAEAYIITPRNSTAGVNDGQGPLSPDGADAAPDKSKGAAASTTASCPAPAASCSCGSPETYSLNPAETVVHRMPTDGPCVVIARADHGRFDFGFIGGDA